MGVRELTPDEFNERLLPIFQHAHDKFAFRMDYARPGKFQPEEFFKKWRTFMEMGIARTWEVPGAILGAVFMDCLFANYPTATVIFWDSDGKSKSALQLLIECEKQARKQGCLSLNVSAVFNDDFEKMERLFRRMGFKKSETYYVKNL